MTGEVEGNVTPHLPSLISYLPWAVALTALALVLFTAAYYSRLARCAGVRLLRLVPGNLGNSSLLAFIALGSFSVLLIVELSQGVGGILNLLLLGYGSSEQIFERGYLAIGVPWFFVATFFLLDHALARRSVIWASVYAVVLATYVAFLVATGNRGMITYIVIALMVYFHAAVRKLTARALVVIALSAFIGLNLLGITRSSQYESVTEVVERTFTSASSALELSLTDFFYTLTIGEFVVPFETFPQIIRATRTDTDFQLGKTFALAPTFVIPQVIFPDRPKPLARWYMDSFYGSHGASEGRAFFFLSEGYLNFGPAGVFALAVFWGIFWGAVRCFGTQGDSRSFALLYALTVAFLFRCVRGDFTTLTAGLLQQSLSAAIIGILISRLTVSSRFAIRPKQ